MYLDWDEKYKVGVENFDFHHKHLFELMNELAVALNGTKTAVNKEDVLDALADYSLIHLDAEEKAMQTHGYPDYESHKKEHQEMRDRVDEFHRRHNAGEPVATMSILTFISDWWTNHIENVDKKYSEFFSDKGLK